MIGEKEVSNQYRFRSESFKKRTYKNKVLAHKSICD